MSHTGMRHQEAGAPGERDEPGREQDLVRHRVEHRAQRRLLLAPARDQPVEEVGERPPPRRRRAPSASRASSTSTTSSGASAMRSMVSWLARVRIGGGQVAIIDKKKGPPVGGGPGSGAEGGGIYSSRSFLATIAATSALQASVLGLADRALLELARVLAEAAGAALARRRTRRPSWRRRRPWRRPGSRPCVVSTMRAVR